MAEIANRSTWSDVFMYSFTAFLRDRCCAEVTCRQKFRRLNAAESFFSGGVAFVTESLRCARSLPGLCSTHAKRVPRVRPRSSLQRRHVARVSALPQTKTTAVATGYGRCAPDTPKSARRRNAIFIAPAPASLRLRLSVDGLGNSGDAALQLASTREEVVPQGKHSFRVRNYEES